MGVRRRAPVRTALLSALVLLLAGGAAGGADEEMDPHLGRLVDRLQASYGRLETLRADFVQTLRTVALGQSQEEGGVVYLRRPSRMRWEYRWPEVKLAVVDGQRTYLYIPAENQVIVGALDEVERSGAAGLLLAGNVDLRRDFLVQPGPTQMVEPGTAALTLIPREPSEEFTRIDLTFSLENDLPLRIVVFGALGDEMEYRFSGVRTGMSLESTLFQFQPPEGAEVVQAD